MNLFHRATSTSSPYANCPHDASCQCSCGHNSPTPGPTARSSQKLTKPFTPPASKQLQSRSRTVTKLTKTFKPASSKQSHGRPATKLTKSSSNSFTPKPKPRPQPAKVELERISYSDPEFGLNAQHLYLNWSTLSGTQISSSAIGFIYKVLPVSTAEFDRKVALIGNIQLMWHGTIRTCTLGDDPNNLNLCTDLGCSLCRILQGGYSIDKARPTGMLGKGIYFSPLSSKASQYTRNTKSSKYHALILNRVAVGTTCTTAQARNNFTDPPAGYHSVSAGGGGGLVKFDETCIYDADMVLPIMLYLYKAP